MISIKQSFAPSINQEGNAKLTFTGYDQITGIKQITNDKTGEIKDREWAMVRLQFECKGRLAGINGNVSFATSPDLNPDKDLYKTLTAMGFTGITLEEDADGFPQEKHTLDDDGFPIVSTEDSETIAKQIEAFLDNQIGKVFTGKMKVEKGFYKVDGTTLKPLISKNGASKSNTKNGN